MKNLLDRFAPAMCFVLLAISAFTAPTFAQDLDEVTISGRIVDSNNAPVAGASEKSNWTFCPAIVSISTFSFAPKPFCAARIL